MRYRLLVASLLVILTVAVFWPVHNYEFIGWDDDQLVINNPYLNPPTVTNALRFWQELTGWLYIPLTGTAWSALASLSQKFPAEPFGLNPGLFHMANLLVHLLSVLVVFGILRLLLRHGFRESEGENDNDGVSIELAAGVGALIFAIHPLQVESVAWISELKDLLCGLFSFIAIKEYLAYSIASKSADTSAKTKNTHYAIASAAFILALLSKPAAVIVPLVALILDRFAIKRAIKKSGVALIGWFIVAGGFAIVAKSLQQTGVDLHASPLWARPFIAGDALAFYLYKLVFPLQLGIDYGRNPDYVLQQWWLYATWIVPAALLVGIWSLKRRDAFLVSFALFTASLLPVLGFIPFLFQKQSTVADHYLYIPMLGVALGISWLFMNLRGRPAGKAIILFAITLLVVRSSLQLPVWRDSLSVDVHSLKVNPVSYTSHNNLGILFAKRNKLDKAISHYKKALTIRPDSVESHYDLANALKEEGNLTESVFHYEKAIKERPDHLYAHNNLAIVLTMQSEFDKAIIHLKKSIQIRPENEQTHYNLGIVFKLQGELYKATAHFTEALRLRQDFQLARDQLDQLTDRPEKR